MSRRIDNRRRGRPILLEAALDQPPALVWRALTEPALVARWLGEGEIEARVGRRFTLRPDGAPGGETIACEVLEAEPGRRLSYRWRGEGEGPGALDTVVTWILEPTAEGGTRLRLVHDGVPILVQAPEPAGRSRARLAARRGHRPQTASSFGRFKWAA
jgi:uncharacterized protein YndB with AHSA1/START domain